MNFNFPTEIIIGDNCVRQNAHRLRALGSSCLIVTGKSSALRCGALGDVTAALKSQGICYGIYDKITQNPLYSDCAAGAVAARNINAQFIIGIGGGSPLDAAKAVACLAPNPAASEDDMYAQRLENPALCVVAVGTTAGTGSEVTPVAVITSTQGRKKSFRANSAFPVIALGDTRYTEYMPQNTVRSTAADALSHCLESYFNTTSDDFSRLFALEGARLLISQFRRLKSGFHPDKKQRETLYLCSVYGGIAISVTGTCIPHALGYFLTESHGMAHGCACAFWLPAFIDHNEKFAKPLSDSFFAAVGSSPAELKELVGAIVPTCTPAVTPEEMTLLRERWQNNSVLKKAYGDIDAQYLEAMVESEFKSSMKG